MGLHLRRGGAPGRRDRLRRPHPDLRPRRGRAGRAPHQRRPGVAAPHLRRTGRSSSSAPTTVRLSVFAHDASAASPAPPTRTPTSSSSATRWDGSSGSGSTAHADLRAGRARAPGPAHDPVRVGDDVGARRRRPDLPPRRGRARDRVRPRRGGPRGPAHARVHGPRPGLGRDRPADRSDVVPRERCSAGATGSTLADRLGGGAPTTTAPASGPRVLERRTYDYTHGHLTRSATPATGSGPSSSTCSPASSASRVTAGPRPTPTTAPAT